MKIENTSYVPYIARTQAAQSAASGKAETAATGQAASSYDTVTISAEAKAAQSAASVGNSSNATTTSGETTFTSSARESSRILGEHKKMLEENYGKQHQENMRFSDPRQHIRDKYKNENSKYFRSDMTARERDLAYDQEIRMLNGVRLKVSAEDYVFNGMEHELTLSHRRMTINQNTRDQIEGAIRNTLMQNGITLPEGASFNLAVDPYDHYISVLGLEDTSMTTLIEQLLNTGNNGRNLYYHIQACNPEMYGFETPEQYTKIDQMKSSLFHMVKDLSGLDIRTLTRAGNTFKTPDGKDLWEVLTKAASALPKGDGTTGVDINDYRKIYEEIAKNGWQDDPGLSLTYRDGSLYDIGTENGYGPGQTAWQDWVRNNPAEVAERVMKYVNERAIELQVQREDDL